MTRIDRIGELDTIKRLGRFLDARADVIAGAGDDCAVVRPWPDSPLDWLLTSDPVVEGRHFRSEAPDPAIGHKAVGRVLSDLAAMGGQPLWALIDVVAPGHVSVERLEGIYGGASALARRYGLTIVGGDLSEGPVLELHAFAVGSVPRGSALLRSGARPGDALFVTGELGGSSLGRHLSFEPRVAEGQWLRAWARAMIDVSDGLATDVRHLAARSGVGVRLDLDNVPVSAEASRTGDGRPALVHALEDGEDFELLFAVAPEREEAFLRQWPPAFPLRCTRIGRATPDPGVVEAAGAGLTAAPLSATGYEHFRVRAENGGTS